MEPTLHSFGGSALDRHVFDFETVADPSAATSGDPAAGGPSPTADASAPVAEGEPDPSSSGATDAAAAWTPEQIAPEYPFQQFLSEEAAAIAQAQLYQLIGSQQGGQPGGQPQPDGQGRST
jgi:hypothetical protein